MVIAAGDGGGEGPGEDVMARVAIDITDDAEVAAAAEQQQGICRICQLGDGALPEHVSGRLVRLGCGCRRELAVALRRCAEAWFTIRGGRCVLHGLALSLLSVSSLLCNFIIELAIVLQNSHECRNFSPRNMRNSFSSRVALRLSPEFSPVHLKFILLLPPLFLFISVHHNLECGNLKKSMEIPADCFCEPV
jgi:hypothetical protein